MKFPPCSWSLTLVLLAFGSARGDEPAKPVSRVAFGSCAHQDDPQPIWDAVNAARPELFLIIGDSIYHDVFRDKKNKEEMLEEKYAKAKNVPGFAKLLKSCKLLGTWDDHDYGKNDAGAEYPFKKEAQQTFLDFLGVPKDSPRRTQEGVYNAALFGPPEQRLQVILLDTRYFRGPLKTRGKGFFKDGPYDPNPDKTSSMLGETQWQWLETQLKVPAQVRLIASSIQVVAQDHHWEKWLNLPHERERLYALLRSTKAAGVVLLSGDRHLGELSMMDAGLGYPLYDLTSSGLTMASKTWRPLEVNRHRVATMNTGNNFGLITIDWQAKDPLIRLQIRDEEGDITINEKVVLSTLQPGKWKTKGPVAASNLPRLPDGTLLNADEVKKRLKQEITVEFQVLATGMNKASNRVFLNSAKDRTSEDNLTIVLEKNILEALKKSGIAMPRTHFEGKTIRVTGPLSLFADRPQIKLDDPAKIQVVE